jgi:creatinine amidohydrolase
VKISIFVLSILAFTLIGVTVYGAVENDIQPDNSIFKDTMVDMTWPEVKKAAENGAIVLFPIAVVEEHGPHMDLSPDIYQTCLGCRFLKQELEKKGIHSVIAPPYYWGINAATGRFPGSFTQAYAEDRYARTQLADHIDRHARFIRRAGPR